MVDVDALYEVISRTITNGYGTTAPVQVWVGQPNGLVPGPGPFAAFWFTGESDKEETLGNVMVWLDFEVAFMWHYGLDLETRGKVERAVTRGCREVQAALRLNSKLDGLVEGMRISDAQIGPQEFGGAPYRSMQFTLQVWCPEEEEIVA